MALLEPRKYSERPLPETMGSSIWFDAPGPYDPPRFSLANTNYELVEGRYRATGVFDLGEAHIGDGEEDLVRFLFRRKRRHREAFLTAYSKEWPFRPGALDRLALYALADFLFMWEVSRRVTHWFGDATFIDTVRPVIDTARAAAG